jgi:hypothetical protein
MSSLTVLEQRLDEVETLRAEAELARNRLVIEACERTSIAMIRGITPTRDDMLVLQQYIARRQQQNRYGQ